MTNQSVNKKEWYKFITDNTPITNKELDSEDDRVMAFVSHLFQSEFCKSRSQEKLNKTEKIFIKAAKVFAPKKDIEYKHRLMFELDHRYCITLYQEEIEEDDE